MRDATVRRVILLNYEACNSALVDATAEEEAGKKLFLRNCKKTPTATEHFFHSTAFRSPSYDSALSGHSSRSSCRAVAGAVCSKQTVKILFGIWNKYKECSSSSSSSSNEGEQIMQVPRVTHWRQWRQGDTNIHGEINIHHSAFLQPTIERTHMDTVFLPVPPKTLNKLAGIGVKGKK